MVRIRQHGSNNELFDIARFLFDVDRFAPPATWFITVDWCIGERAAEIEQLTQLGCLMGDADFRAVYADVRQTIDGRFIGLRDGERLFELTAVDSSFWEVSGSESFEIHMLASYGAWSPSISAPTE